MADLYYQCSRILFLRPPESLQITEIQYPLNNVPAMLAYVDGFGVDVPEQLVQLHRDGAPFSDSRDPRNNCRILCGPQILLHYFFPAPVCQISILSAPYPFDRNSHSPIIQQCWLISKKEKLNDWVDVNPPRDIPRETVISGKCREVNDLSVRYREISAINYMKGATSKSRNCQHNQEEVV